MTTVSIPLTRGLFALIDEADAEGVLRFRWYAVPARATFYAARREGAKLIYLHRQLLGLIDTGRVVFSDHDDGNGLNNCRRNLVRCTPAQNSQKRQSARSKTGFRGVYLQRGRFIARIGHNGQFDYLGTFDRAEDASAAYVAAAQRLFGAFAPKGL